MSLDPEKILSLLTDASRDPGMCAVVGSEQCAWLLAQLKHKDDRIAALTALVKPPAPPAPPAPEETILQEADRITSTERQRAYGHPYYNFTRTARIWEVVLDKPAGSITPEMVGLAMIGLKIARELHGHKRDNLTDIAGFAKTVQACAEFDLDDQP